MPQLFALTWIDVLLALIPFTIIYIHRFFDNKNVHKAVKVILHPIVLLSSFVFIVIYFSRF